MRTKRILIAGAIALTMICNGQFPLTQAKNLNETVGPKLLVSRAEEEVLVYPNPNNGNFFVRTNNFDESPEMMIYDLNNEHVVYQGKLNMGVTSISIGSSAKGVYIYRIYSPVDGNVQSSGKIIVQ